MYNTKHQFKKFDTTTARDMDEYQAILNNPLCTIVDNYREKLSDKVFDEGKLVGINERVILVVEWNEKYIA